MRAALLFAHRWFGLAAALWLGFLGLSGAVLVYYDELDRAFNPDWRLVEQATGPALPLDPLVRAAEARMPGSYVRFVDLPNSPERYLELTFMPRAEALTPDQAGWQAFMDPYSGAWLGARRFGDLRFDRRHILDVIYQLHADLMLGAAASWCLGLLALLWIFDHVAGAALSFPIAARWRESFRIRRKVSGHKRTFDLHRAGGLWLLPVTLTMGVTGLSFTWPESFEAALRTITSDRPSVYANLPDRTEPVFAPQINVDQAIAAAEAHGGAKADLVVVFPGKGVYRVDLFDPRDLNSFGARIVFIDMQSGAVLGDQHLRDEGPGHGILAWMLPLHNGRAFGDLGRLLAFLGGLGVCVLSFTGIALFLHRRASRGRLARRAGPPAQRPLGSITER